jgi:hypothetical protein
LVPSPLLAWPDPSAITQVGPEVQLREGRTGAVTGPVAGAGKYTDGPDQVAPSQDTVTPDPELSDAGSPSVPPPTATHKVSERHESEVKPPPGGNSVRASVQPAAWVTGAGVLVGVAEGRVVVVGRGTGAAVVVVVVAPAGA